MKLLNSILSGIESTLDTGDLMLDPFYLLDIESIELSDDISLSDMFYYIIDDTKLNKQTKDFNYTFWKHLTYTNKFIKNTEELNEKIIRFLWYIAYKIVYREQPYFPKFLSFKDIIKVDTLCCQLCLYTYKAHFLEEKKYVIEVVYLTGTVAKITIKNNKNL